MRQISRVIQDTPSRHWRLICLVAFGAVCTVFVANGIHVYLSYRNESISTKAIQKMGGDVLVSPRPLWLNRIVTKCNGATPNWMQRVTTVNLSQSSMTDEDIDVVLQCPYSEICQMQSTKITDAGIWKLSGLSHLRELYLSDTHLTDGGCQVFNETSHLMVLYLDGTSVGDGGLQLVVSARDLESLSLSGTHITDRGVSHLTSLRSMKYLSLAGTEITDRACESLSKMPWLEELDLSHTGISPAGIGSIERISALKRISLEGTKATPASVRSLKDAIPGVQISW